MEGLDIDVRTPSVGTPPPKVSTLASASSSSGGRIHQVGSFAVGTIHASEMRFPPLGEEHGRGSQVVDRADAMVDLDGGAAISLGARSVRSAVGGRYSH